MSDISDVIDQPIAIHEVQVALFEALDRYTALSTAYRVLQAEHRHLESDVVIDRRTGIGTRRAAEEALKLAIAQSRRQKSPLTIIVIHSPGLRESDGTSTEATAPSATAAFRSTLRAGDGLFWWSSNELLLMLPFTTMDAGAVVLARAQSALAAHGSSSMSIGMAELVYEEGAPDFVERARMSSVAHDQSQIVRNEGSRGQA